MSYLVIDISKWQGNINFQAVKDSNLIGGVVMRAGVGDYTTGALRVDSKFERNAQGFKSVGIPMGIYYFSQAATEADAIMEANFCIEQARKYGATKLIAYDLESEGRIANVSKEQLTRNVIAFCSTVAAAGLPTCLYTYLNFLSSRVNEASIRANNIDIWIAHYTTTAHPEYATKYTMWQYTSSGSIPGIDGRVDMNYCYKDYFTGGTQPMATFVKRTTAPSSTDKNWINTAYGGYNHAIKIGSDGSVLPNCTGYCHGRWLELGLPESKLCLNNAEIYWNYNDGFPRSQTPKLGAIICWRKGEAGPQGDGAGHVAIVEEIYSDGTVLASQSNYGGTRFYTQRINPKTWPGGAYTFQGYLCPPIDFGGSFIEPVKRDATVNQVEVAYDFLNARSNPYLASDSYGYIPRGIYNVLATKDMRAEASNGYFWYQVADHVWIADIGADKTIYMPASENPKDYSSLLKIGYASGGDMKQIKALLEEMSIGYTEPEAGYVVTSVAPSKGDRTKIESLCNSLGVPCVEYASNNDAKEEEQNQKIAMLEAENQKLKTENEALKTSIADAEEDLLSYETRNAELEKQNKLYQEVMTEIESSLAKI